MICRHHPQRDPAPDNKIANAVAVIGVEPCGCICREYKDQLLQAVRQHLQQEQRGGKIKKIRPFWQPVIFRPPERERNEHAEQRNEQHRNIIAVPEVSDGGRRGGKEKLDRPDAQPEHAVRRRRRQIPPHLRLHNALPERNAPPRHEADVDQAPQQRHRQEVRSLPMPARNDARGHGADDQKRRNAAGQNLAFFCASSNHLPEWLFIKHTI